jgi:hypothetical protein
VATTAEEGWCPACGVRARSHDRRPRWVRDLPAGGRPVTLVWVKRSGAWSGRSAFIADPEGSRWEITWSPRATFDERGALSWD